MRHAVIALMLTTASVAPIAQGNSAQNETTPTFEVASVRPNIGGEGVYFTYQGGRFKATNVTLLMLIRSSYNVQESQIVGGPKWINADRFDILAKGDVGLSPAPTVIQTGGPSRLQLMMRALLVDRFKLVVHIEKRESNVYALVLERDDGRLGSGLRHSDVDCAVLAAEARRAAASAQTAVSSQPPPPNGCGLSRGAGLISMGGRPLSQLVSTLSTIVDRPVLDETGLTGNFNITLTWTPEPRTGPGAANAAEPLVAPSDSLPIFTAIREQLGLKLVPRKTAAEVLVVDSAERPAEN